MEKAPYNLLLQTASRDNILTLTTACSTACIFCSHNQNPPGIEAYYVNKLSCEEALNIAEFLDKNQKIVIGESATRICEGEPFLYPEILPVLTGIRKRFRSATIQITTSAVPLRLDMLESIKSLGGIELNISLNSSTERGRSILYGGKPHMQAVETVRELQKLGIRFSGSIVAMPQLVGMEDIEETVNFLSGSGADLIRIFVPGFTKYSRLQPPVEADIHGLKRLIASLREKIEVPITLEPELLEDLHALVLGVVKDSAAGIAGLKRDDLILSVNNEPVFSRVDAYYKLFGCKNPQVQYMRGDTKAAVTLEKDKKTPSGLVFSYDIHPDTVSRLQRALQRHEGKQRLIMTSELAYKIICSCIKQDECIRIEMVENRFFGGNIRCAGLLTLEDIIRHLESSSIKPQVVLLPSIMFDRNGKDLTGKSVDDIAEQLGIIVEVV